MAFQLDFGLGISILSLYSINVSSIRYPSTFATGRKLNELLGRFICIRVNSYKCPVVEHLLAHSISIAESTRLALVYTFFYSHTLLMAFRVDDPYAQIFHRESIGRMDQSFFCGTEKIIGGNIGS